MLEVIIVASEEYLDCTLTVDYGDGIERHHTFMVINQRVMKRVLLLKSGFKRITLSPSEKTVSLSVSKMTFVKLTTRAAYRFMHKKLMTYKAGNDFTRSLHLWRHYENLYKLQHKSETDYQDWIDRREFNELKRAFHLTQKEKFCFIVDATYCREDLNDIPLTLDSIQHQTYTLWDIVVVTPAMKADLNLVRLLSNTRSPLVNCKVIKAPRSANLFCDNLLEISDADHFVTVEPGTIFSPYALSVFARHQQENPKCSLLYSDHDTINSKSERHSPILKPDWNPDLMLSTNYIGSTVVISRSFLNTIESRGELFLGLLYWLYEILIKIAINHSARPYHIQQIIYHLMERRHIKTKLNPEKKLEILRKKLNSYAGTAKKTSTESVFKTEWPLPTDNPLVSIIIPTKDNLATLKRALESIKSRTDYSNYEILIINNQSKDVQTLDFFNRIKQEKHIRVINYNKPFNYSAINNFAVQFAKGSYILLLNDDTEVINKQWLAELLRHASRQDIGCVGAKLLYPDGRIQHGGVIVGLSGCAGHSHKFYQEQDKGYMQRLVCIQNYSAVTAACLLVKKDLYLRVGGLNEEHLSVAFNDVDFCLKVQALGYRNLWTPWSQLYHYESVSRGQDDTTKKRKRLTSEVLFMKKTWNTTLYQDPYYNRRLTSLREDFSLGF